MGRKTNFQIYSELYEAFKIKAKEGTAALFEKRPLELYEAYNKGVTTYDVIGLEAALMYDSKRWFFGEEEKPTRAKINELKMILDNWDAVTFERPYYKVKNRCQNYSVTTSRNPATCKRTFFTLEEAEKEHKILAEKRAFENEQRELIKANYSAYLSGFAYLGWANGWAQSPEEVVECRDKGHEMLRYSTNNKGTDNTYFCPYCKIYFKVDSSD